MTQRSKRILVVDDEENARTTLLRILKREGFEVASAGNGLEALDFLRKQKVDIVITDINMPEMSGMAFLRELNKTYPGTNVIMITAYGEIESYIEAMNLGAFEYINKPFRIDELKETIYKITSNPKSLHSTGGTV